MLAKTGKLWWLVVVCAFLAGLCTYPMVVWGLYAAAARTDPGKQMFIGRTTIMESADGQPVHNKTRLGNLRNIIMSQAALSNAAQSLSDMGMDPQQVLSGVSVTPVKDTDILAIEVTLPDAKEAKVAADVIASEMKKAYVRLYSGKSAGTVKTIDPAFVRPASHLNIAGSLLSFITNPVFGPAVGVIVGLALGLMLAALFRNRRQPISHQQGV